MPPSTRKESQEPEKKVPSGKQVMTGVYNTVKDAGILMTTLGIITILLIALLIWIFHKIGLQKESCQKLEVAYSKKQNFTYFNGTNSIKPDAQALFDNSNSTLINYFVKSSYNSCCGDEYKNNFVALCALEKCIFNGFRFLDFEIYSYNNDPIVASSTANNNFIKETYNALLLSEVLKTITENAFDATKTDCHNDPLILNFRVMSTNVTMLEKMSDLLEEYLVLKSNFNYSLLTSKEADVLNTEMKALYKKIIIICDFNTAPGILDQNSANSKLTKLKNYINLKAIGNNCNTFRLREIDTKNGTPQFLDETKRKFTIVLPHLENSKINFDSVTSFRNGCQAICMKNQNNDTNLIGYNTNNFSKFSWKIKPAGLINEASLNLNFRPGINLRNPPQGGGGSGWYGTVTITGSGTGNISVNVKVYKTDPTRYFLNQRLNVGSSVIDIPITSRLANTDSKLFFEMTDTGTSTILGNVSITGGSFINGSTYNGYIDEILPTRLGTPITITWSGEFNP
jgi:hypothetical protein